MVASKVGSLVFGIAASIIVARALGADGRGLVAVGYSLARILIQFGTAGVLTANPYYAARSSDMRGRIVTNSLWLALVIGTALMAAGVALTALAPGIVRGLTWTQVLLALGGVPLALANQFLHSVLLGEGRMIAYNAYELVLSGLSTAVVFVVLIPLGGGVTAALAVTLAGYAVGALTWLALLVRHRPGLAPDLGALKVMVGYGFRAYVATLFGFLVIRVDTLFVNSYLGAEQAGLYAVAVALVDGLFLFPTIVADNLFPRIARGGETAMTAEVFRLVAVLYGFFCLVTIPFAGFTIRHLFGPDFVGATSLYYWILPGAYSLGMIAILSNHFAGRGFPARAVVVWVFALALDIVILVLFLDREGTYVASLASSITYCVLLLLHMGMFAREAGGWDALRPRPREVVRMVRVALSRG
jgi:O-antigen/teichoic acid export membrane protein